ncbi:MAG: MAPEG family protein [Burkholderiales bacterium]
MTLAYWMVLLAALLPYLAVGFSKWRHGYNNGAPRVGIEQLPPAKQRAYWAHLNAFEAFPPFAAAVIIAHLAHASQPVVDGLAVLFVAARIAHFLLYIGNLATLRSVAWTIGVGCVIALFVVSA